MVFCLRLRVERTALIIACLCSTFISGKEPVPNSEYASLTVVIYNQNVAESRKLAAYYASKRNIPYENLIGLKCSTEETISRIDYRKTIRDPLRQQFDANGWWERKKDVRGNLRATQNGIKIAAIMFGMPLKIERAPIKGIDRKKSDSLKTAASNQGHENNDAASVDSEIAALGIDLPRLSGATRNPYFRSTEPEGRPDLLMTARLDGPDYVTAKRLIDDAITAEQSGLWGRAVIDIANLAEEKGEGYKVGDDWLENCADFYKKAGIPALVDRFPACIPKGYPLGEDVILYFGWYTPNAEGPFVDPRFKFKCGAIAAHIHSYSAGTLRSTLKNWCGPLLSRGACAVLGNVYEPFLKMSTHFDLFNARLLGGFTFAEASWMATPVLSWMQVMIGDPLYQPFSLDAIIEKDPDPDFKAFRLAVMQWNSEPEKLFSNLEKAAESLSSANVLEAMGLHLMAERNYEGANSAFVRAGEKYGNSEDQLRQRLNCARAALESGDSARALKLLAQSISDFKGEPGLDAATVIANRIRILRDAPGRR